MTDLRAPFPWFGDAMAYAKAHVTAGVLRVDPDGSVWRCKRRRGEVWSDMKPRRVENLGGKGYLRVSLHVGQGYPLAIVMAHRLVYELLVGPIPGGLEIDHINGDKRDNRPSNLEPVTAPENMRRSYKRPRTRPWALARAAGSDYRGRPMVTLEQRDEARKMRACGSKLREIAKHFGISMTHAQRISAEESAA
jgi:hypothetical protein